MNLTDPKSGAKCGPEELRDLYVRHFGEEPHTVKRLAGAGSNRAYYRLEGPKGTAIGTVGTVLAENKAFITLSRHFAGKGLAVPSILEVSADGMCYLQDDLGDVSLFGAIQSSRESGQYSPAHLGLMAESLKMIASIQTSGAEGLDFGVCYPEPEMNERMIRWDLNYFKYDFLKILGIEIDELSLEREFDAMATRLSTRCRSAETFMARDFQSRNVMLAEGEKPYLIDFQGGRRGPMEYDVASFLWQARASLSPQNRRDLVEVYICEMLRLIGERFDEAAFRQSLPLMVVFRMLQILGAYGLRGLSQRRPHFLASIPAALRNLADYLDESRLGAEFPYLRRLADECQQAREVRDLSMITSVKPMEGVLTVTVSSFSFKRGVPVDLSGNGGGFVFDCRAVHNPGRYDRYKPLTGRDPEVKDFIEENGEILPFLENAEALVKAAVARYLERGFTSLCVCFGCTGGRHRSVYSADSMARLLRKLFPQIRVVVWHREQEILEEYKPEIAQR